MNDQTKIVVANSFKHLAPINLGEGISSGFSSITYKGKNWALKQSGEDKKFFVDDKGQVTPYLDVVILAMNANISKMFYTPGTYSEDSTGAPICTSLNGDVPDPGVPEQQSPSCATCKHNAWGSAPSGGRGKACQDHRKLAVLLLPYMTKQILEKPLIESVYLKIPPASLKPLKIYGDSLVHRGIHCATVITRITFVPGKQFEMKFELKQALTDQEAPVILRLLDDPQTKNIVGGRAEIYEDDAPPPPVEQPADTGLMAAFDQPTPDYGLISPTLAASGQLKDGVATGQGLTPVKRGPGRPKKPKEPEQTVSKQAAVEEGEQQPPWQADSDLEDAVAKALEHKTSNMLK